MATLVLFQPNASLVETNYYESHMIDATSTGWFQATDYGVVYSQLSGSGITYNSYGDPLLGTITSARSINENGNTNWTVSGIGITSNNTYNINEALKSGNPFTSNMVNVILSNNDTIVGSGGSDIFVYSSGKDIINGGNGIDTIDFYQFEYRDNIYGSLIVNLEANNYTVTTNSNVVVTSTIYNVENVIGSFSDDRMTGNSLNNRLIGNDGDDVIYGRGGNDYIDGGRNNYYNDKDQLYGELGDDFIISSYGNTFIGFLSRICG